MMNTAPDSGHPLRDKDKKNVEAHAARSLERNGRRTSLTVPAPVLPLLLLAALPVPVVVVAVSGGKVSWAHSRLICSEVSVPPDLHLTRTRGD